MEKVVRRYDLDWLRVLVFALLIFYHVGMFFIHWGWHIKNNVIYEELRWPMAFLNQWRLPILFVIAGMGTYYALGKRSTGKFILERYLRLGIPLAVGMALIVPPQVYIERLADGDFTGSYFDFFPAEAFKGIYPKGNLSWHHLWFLPYLFLYSLILAPLLVYLRRRESKFKDWVRKLISNSWGLYLFVVPLFVVVFTMQPLFPVTHALVGDWFTITKYIILFFYGFVLVTSGDVFWESVSKIKNKALIIGVIAFTCYVCIQLFMESGTLKHAVRTCCRVVNVWSWILVLFGYAAKYLNRPSRTLAYANRAVYPFYILHQTITVIIGYFLMDLNWSFLSKASILVVGTFGISWLIYDLIILRIKWLHPLFGLKSGKRKQPPI